MYKSVKPAYNKCKGGGENIKGQMNNGHLMVDSIFSFCKSCCIYLTRQIESCAKELYVIVTAGGTLACVHMYLLLEFFCAKHSTVQQVLLCTAVGSCY